jgi:hypothetical protein
MDIKIYKKPVVTEFVMIDGKEFELGELESSLIQIMEQTEENDSWGDYSLRSYELYNYEVTNELVKMGLVKNYTGSRMADLYCMKDEKKIKDLLHTLYEMEKANKM